MQHSVIDSISKEIDFNNRKSSTNMIFLTILYFSLRSSNKRLTGAFSISKTYLFLRVLNAEQYKDSSIFVAASMWLTAANNAKSKIEHIMKEDAPTMLNLMFNKNS